MSDVKFTSNLPELFTEVEAFEKKLTGLDTAFQKVNRSGESAFQGVADSVVNANRDMGGYITKAQDMAKAEDQATRSTSLLSSAVSRAADEIKVGGSSVSELVGRFKEKVGVLRNVVSGLGAGSGALRAFRVALISTGIGAIVVLLGSLYALFTRNQKAVDQVNKVMAGFGAVINVILDRLAALAAPIGKAVESMFQLTKAAGQFVTGNFSGAIDSARKGTAAFGEAVDGTKAALSGMGDEMVREAQLAAELEGNLQKITRAQQLLNIQRAGSKLDIEKLKGLSEDESKASGQRISAAQKAYGIEQSLLRKQLESQKALIANTLGQTAFTEKTASFINKLKTGTIEFDDALKQVGFSDSLAADFQAVESQVIELFNIEEESLGVQTSLNNKLNEIRQEAARKQAEAQKEEKRRVDELLKKYENITEALTDNATAVGDEQATAEEKVIRVRDRAIAQLQGMKDELNDLTAKLRLHGKAVEFDVDGIIEGITDFLNVEAQRELDKIKFPVLPVGIDVKPFVKKRNGEVITEVIAVNTEVGLQFDDTKAKSEFDKRADALFKSLSDQQKRIAANAKDKANFNVWDDIFGLNPENDEDKAIIDGIRTAANEIIGIIGQVSAARLEAANAAVEATDKEVAEAQRRLDVELAIAQLGFASNVDLRKKEFDEAEAARKKAIEAQKKAQKQQMVVDTITQTVNLITASTNIFKSLSAIPFIGVPLAIGVIATMFAAFAKVKADSFKAAKFGDGGEGYVNSDGVVVGRRHAQGGVPIEVEDGELFRTDGKRFSVVKRAMTEKHQGLLRAVNNDDTAEIARYAISMAAAEGIRFESLDYGALSERHTDGAQAQAVTVKVSGADNTETNELLKEQLQRMPKVERWQNAQGHHFERFGNVTFKTV